MQAHAGFLVKNGDLPSKASAGGIVGERDIGAAGDGAAYIGKTSEILRTVTHADAGFESRSG